MVLLLSSINKYITLYLMNNIASEKEIIYS
jgi:hypothetical protein